MSVTVVVVVRAHSHAANGRIDGRDGCYGLGRLIEKRGRDAKLVDWLAAVGLYKTFGNCGHRAPHQSFVLPARFFAQSAVISRLDLITYLSIADAVEYK